MGLGDEHCKTLDYSHILKPQQGVQTFEISAPHWKKSCLGPHIVYIVACNHKKKSYNVLSKFMTFCWAAFSHPGLHAAPQATGLTSLLVLVI